MKRCMVRRLALGFHMNKAKGVYNPLVQPFVVLSEPIPLYRAEPRAARSRFLFFLFFSFFPLCKIIFSLCKIRYFRFARSDISVL